MQISYIGMQTQEVAIKPNLRVVLKSDAQLIDEVVVTGYGVTKKAAFTGSAQTVDNKDLMKKTDANFMKSLEGSVAGLQVNSLTGQPGAYASTTIRGVGSMNSGTEPLYVIDGIAIYTDKMGAYNKAGTGDMAASPMANINPNDIESITVLKDATATAIYGARAANGVIVVTTKKGSLGKARFNVNAKVGTSFVGKIDHNYRTTNLDKYKEIWTEGLTNAGYDGEDGMTSAEWLNAYVMDWYNVDLTQNIKSVDWLKEILQNGFSQEYDISAQGGNENLRYYISGGYFQNTGIVIGTGMKRYSGRISLDGKSGRIGYGLSVNGALSDINNTMTESQYTNPIVAVYDIRPFEQVRNEDGTYNTNVNYNPVAINDKEKGDKRNQKQITLVVNPYFTYNIIDGLTWKTNAGLSLIDLDEFFYSSIYNPQYSGSGMLGQRNQERATTLTITNTVNFNRTFKDMHHLNVLLGQEAQKISYRTIYAAASGYPSDAVFELDNASKPTGAGSSTKASTLSSFFMNAEYNLNDKYYLSGSFRYDGSSRFGVNNKWAPFWSIGAKYRISNESFMENTKSWLTDLTIRGSYGTVGNQDIGYYAAMGLYNYGYSYNGKPGAIPYQIANPDLKWEKKAEFNVGVDMTMFDNHLSFTFDYYKRTTSNLLYDYIVPTPPYVYNTLFTNVGKVTNEGVELTISGTPFNTRDFTWNTSLTVSHNKNKLVKFTNDEFTNGTYKVGWSTSAACYTQRLIEGQSLGTFYGPIWLGTDTDGKDVLLGQNADGSVPEEQWEKIGCAYPDATLSWSNTFRYKKFDLSFSLRASIGGEILNNYAMEYENLSSIGLRNISSNWLSQTNFTSTTYKYSSKYIEDASYLKLDNVTFGYTWDFTSKMIKRLRLSLTAQNVFCITGYSGVDPEVALSGLEPGMESLSYYPRTTEFTFGVNIVF